MDVNIEQYYPKALFGASFLASNACSMIGTSQNKIFAVFSGYRFFLYCVI